MMVQATPRLTTPIARLKMRLSGAGRRETWLALGHLFVVALALEDEEAASALLDILALDAAWLGRMEALVIVAVLALQGLVTLGWVRCSRPERPR
ncbi:hypothetical protein [Rubrimonas cliftonensis]|uniref:Uncharacterized protein n=1 Tax=Rubrimonas cliftonensis TaxID=89524 RepID=A0A1H4BC62_9RHOB|nr:hypothetical protein [Rubrimonas cliftonensis]SEA45721.1 hypothetical protein SAMN05444370_105129 [Rubrimonas cliftonensis]